MTDQLRASTASDGAWHEFLTRPAVHVDAARLSACFDGRIDEVVCRTMLTTPRLIERLSNVLERYYSLGADSDLDACDQVDRGVALATGETLAGIARRSGAVYWATGLASVVLTRDVETLYAALGEDVCTYALACRDLSEQDHRLPPIEETAATIIADGWRCLWGWSERLPPAIAKRVRLKFPDIVEPTIKRGYEIVRRAGAIDVAAG